MDDWGRITLTYQSKRYPNSFEPILPSIDMTISAEADLSEMLSFFDSFLKATGYQYEGKVKVG